MRIKKKLAMGILSLSVLGAISTTALAKLIIRVVSGVMVDITIQITGELFQTIITEL
ncbi:MULTISPECIES: hypothetical protein [unclassified Granulicatella]|uniref:hypothetical protein n=1 Tax=unclassified Granulicatella TaxID=2630493 RepID=UPI001D16826B|nr:MULTISPECIES: hypothetical protein [unclassified Granulicatella]